MSAWPAATIDGYPRNRVILGEHRCHLKAEFTWRAREEVNAQIECPAIGVASQDSRAGH